MKSKCVGFVETMGYVTAVEAADAGVKSANVSLLSCEITSALITVVFEGDVGAVKAAVSAAYNAASKIGQVVGGHIIPRPSEEFKGFEDGTPYPFAAGSKESLDVTKKVAAKEKKVTDRKKRTAAPQSKNKSVTKKQRAEKERKKSANLEMAAETIETTTVGKK
jgi:microcompartment protein CcmL/EutN